MKLFRKIALLLVAACFTTAMAQDGTCSATIQQAISVVQNDCGATGRNQACYGYVSLSATPRQDVQNFTFSQQGDLANVGDIETLRLSAFDPVDKTWGVALMKLQANLPDTLPGQNVTFLMFGDVQVQNGVAPTGATLEVTAKSNSNVRSGPSPSYRVIGSLSGGDTATATGRSQDNQWLRIQFSNSETQGWVSAASVTAAGDISQLSAISASEAEVAYKPMQAFYFQTGVGATKCAEAPQNGILVQTPSGVGTVNLRANDVDIQLGSTVFMQAQNGFLIISVLEGQITVTAGGKSVVVPAGAQTQVLIDANLHAAGRPSAPVPYDPTALLLLPIQLLPDQITVADPASADTISQVNLPVFSVPGVGVTGIVGDVASLANLPLSEFCPLIDQAAAQANMTRDNYLELLNQAALLSSGATQDQLAKVHDMLSQCP